MLARVLRSIMLGALFLCALSSTLFAQQAFPLAVGNSWHYAIDYFNENPFRIVHYTIRVVCDTVMPNGKVYAVLDSADMFGQRYLRADSTYLYYWDRTGPDGSWADHRTFNLRPALGEVDTINLGLYRTCAFRPPTHYPIFGRMSTVRPASLDGGIVFDEVTLADGFGYYSFEYSADWGTEQYAWYLQGCVIGDTIYGAMTALKSSTAIPARAELHQNYPNPFNPATIISYNLTSRTHVALAVYNLLGQHVATLVNGLEEPGSHTVVFNGTSLSTGVYVYRLQAGEYVVNRKMLMVR